MGNSYTGGNHYDEQKSKKFIRKLLRRGGMEEPEEPEEPKKSDESKKQNKPIDFYQPNYSENYSKYKEKQDELNINQLKNFKRTIIVNYDDYGRNDIDREMFDIGEGQYPCFISLTDDEKVHELCTFNIFVRDTILPINKDCYYVSKRVGTIPGDIFPQFEPNIVYRYRYLDDLCKFLHEGEPSEKKLTLYNVGEYIYQEKEEHKFIAPNRNTPCYDDAYYFYVPSDEKILQVMLQNGQPYEKYNTAYFSMFIPPGAIIIDVGANIGTVSIPLSRLHGGNVTIIACEGVNRTRKILDKNININKAYNVLAVEGAIGDEQSERVSFDLSDDKVNPGHNRMGEALDSKETIITRMKTVDSMLDQLGGWVHALKIDVEGAEGLVFWGARETIKRCKPVIMFEKVNDIIGVQKYRLDRWRYKFMEYLKELGYKLLYKLQQFDFLAVHPNSFRQMEINKELADNFKVFRVRKIHNNEAITRPEINIEDLNKARKNPVQIFAPGELNAFRKFEVVRPHGESRRSNLLSLYETVFPKQKTDITLTPHPGLPSRKETKQSVQSDGFMNVVNTKRKTGRTLSLLSGLPSRKETEKSAQSNTFMAVADEDDEDEGATKEY